MRWTKVLFALVVPTFPARAESPRLIDLGVRSEALFLGLDVIERDGYDALAFSLVRRETGRAVRLNNCRYPRHRLAIEVENVRDRAVRADLDGLLRVSQSAVDLNRPLARTYPELRDILRRARPECAVPTLGQVTRQLNLAP